MPEPQMVHALVHHHQYGETVYLYRGAPDRDAREIAIKLKVDLEPEKGEWVAIDSVDIANIPELDNTPVEYDDDDDDEDEDEA
jgi:hypothetical protein